MPDGGDRVTMAEWLRMSGLWWTCVLRGEIAWLVSMPRLPPPDLADRRHDLRLDPPAAAPLVPRHVSPDPEQAGHLEHRTWPPSWRDADHRLEDQAQAGAGDDGA